MPDSGPETAGESLHIVAYSYALTPYSSFSPITPFLSSFRCCDGRSAGPALNGSGGSIQQAQGQDGTRLNKTGQGSMTCF
jgi:hypothetical protein